MIEQAKIENLRSKLEILAKLPGTAMTDEDLSDLGQPLIEEIVATAIDVSDDAVAVRERVISIRVLSAVHIIVFGSLVIQSIGSLIENLSIYSVFEVSLFAFCALFFTLFTIFFYQPRGGAYGVANRLWIWFNGRFHLWQ